MFAHVDRENKEKVDFCNESVARFIGVCDKWRSGWPVIYSAQTDGSDYRYYSRHQLQRTQVLRCLIDECQLLQLLLQLVQQIQRFERRHVVQVQTPNPLKNRL